jgi:arylsulfatase A-like enzyme/tetratricopeptide (TPR) repeat protein
MRPYLAFVLASVCSCGSPPEPAVVPQAPTRQKPNFIVVTLDTTRQDVLSPYGGPAEATPTIQAIASEGSVFTRAYTVTPLTIPAHSSLHTGLVPPRHGVRDNGDAFLSPAAVTLAELMRQAGWKTMAAVGAEVTSHHWGFDQGFEAYFDKLDRSKALGNRWKVERPAEEVLDDALPWIQERLAKDEPFFTWIHVFDAHHPYEPVPPYDTLFPNRPYLAEIASVDAQLTRLVGTLQQGGAWNNTWIILLADHGEGMGDHGEGTHGLLLYDPTTRIPLIVRPPMGVLEKRIETPASIVDVFPTILSAAGVALPKELDGVDLGPWMQGAPRPADRRVYAESLYGWRHFGTAPLRAMVTPDHKLIDGPSTQLYGRTDRKEEANLASVDPTVTQGLLATVDKLVSGFQPMAGLAGDAALDEARIQQLAALGYVAEGGGAISDVVPFREQLPEPRADDPLLQAQTRAREAMQARKLPEALQIVEEALQRAPHQRELERTRVELLVQLDRLDEAEKAAKALQEQAPSSQNLLALSDIAARKGDGAASELLLRQALAMDPYLVPAWRRMLTAAYLTADPARVAVALTEARLKIPDDPQLIVMEGIHLSLTGNLDGGKARIDQGLSLEPSLPFGHLHLGQIARKQGNNLVAEAEFLFEYEAFPQSVPALRGLVELYASQKKYQEQLDTLRKIQVLEQPPSLITTQAVGQALFNLQRYAEADVEVDRCIALEPRYPECKLLKANVLSKLGRKDEAVVVFEEAKALKAEEANLRNARPRP